jgi:hypothetical protein
MTGIKYKLLLQKKIKDISSFQGKIYDIYLSKSKFQRHGVE